MTGNKACDLDACLTHLAWECAGLVVAGGRRALVSQFRSSFILRPGVYELRNRRTTFFSFRMLEKPYWETIMIRQEPTQTSMWVRIPAAHSRRSRSNPIRLPGAAAVTRRSIDIGHRDLRGGGSLRDCRGYDNEILWPGKSCAAPFPVGLAAVELVCAMQRRDRRFPAYQPLPRLSFAVRRIVT